MNNDMIWGRRKIKLPLRKKQRLLCLFSFTYLATVPQLTPEVVQELLEPFMDPVRGNSAKRRKTIVMRCLHVDDLFITGTPEFPERWKEKATANFKIGPPKHILRSTVIQPTQSMPCTVHAILETRSATLQTWSEASFRFKIPTCQPHPHHGRNETPHRQTTPNYAILMTRLLQSTPKKKRKGS